jgi:hypothetical protein
LLNKFKLQTFWWLNANYATFSFDYHSWWA